MQPTEEQLRALVNKFRTAHEGLRTDDGEFAQGYEQAYDGAADALEALLEGTK